MKYCGQCGAQLVDSAKFCSVCGSRVSEESQSQSAAEVSRSSGDTAGTSTLGGVNNHVGNPGRNITSQEKEAVQMIVKKMRTSATIWTVIGICQIISGLCTICWGYGVAPLILGIYNLVQCSRKRRNAARFEQEPVGIVNYFESGGMLMVVFLVLNFLAGAFFGVIGSIYDMTVRRKALSLRTQLLDVENIYRATGAF